MESVISYFRRIFADPLFVRVCMFLWGTPFVAIGVIAIASWQPADLIDWMVITPLILATGLLGVILVYVSVFGAQKTIDQTTSLMEGGEIGIVFAIVVGLVAVPITAILRGLRDSSRS